MTRIVALTLALLATAACSSERSGKPSGSEDAGRPPPARTLVPMRLLGDTPVDNHFFNPHFASGGEHWYVISGNSLIAAERYVGPTPTGLAALRLRPTTARRYVIGLLRGGPALSTASVWVGDQLESTLLRPQIAVGGLVPGQTMTTAVELKPEKGTATAIPRRDDESVLVYWKKYSVTLPDPMLGLAYLIYSDSGEGIVYLNGPVLVAGGSGSESASQLSRSAVASIPRGAPRALEAAEREALRLVAEQLQRTPPPPDPASGLKVPLGL